MKKIKFTAALIAAVMLVVSMVSCSRIKVDDDEIISEAARLIEKSLILNDIYWGAGLTAKSGGKKLSEDYTEADVSGVADYGITDMESLREYTRGVYSENECKNLFSIYLTETKYSDTFGDYSYTETYTRYLCDSSGTLYVYKDIENITGGASVSYDCNTIKIKEKTRKTVKIEVNIVVSAPEKEPYEDTVTLEMVWENGNFRLKTPTYAAYDKG